MSVIVYQFQTVRFIQLMSLTFGLFTQVSGSGPLGPLVFQYDQYHIYSSMKPGFPLSRMTTSNKIDPMKHCCYSNFTVP